ncbi:MAG: hypothetical protein ACLUDF_09570 [Butyricicoccus sp.]
MNSYETLSEYYDRFTDDGLRGMGRLFERLFEREGVKRRWCSIWRGTGSRRAFCAARL